MRFPLLHLLFGLVDGGFRAVKFSRIHGTLDRVYPEGTHFLIPWLEQAVVYDVRAKPRNVASMTGTKGMHIMSFRVMMMMRMRGMMIMTLLVAPILHLSSCACL